ncbi:MAG: tRNA 2-thiouridine(34) synthase MnmA [Anaerolineae bacterium]|nr:tRNA 2-thiouridine(34) synthase MnmA [Caldilineales bacterium]MCX7851839.1 tRNA 2-thiouridine(34) synthase MnmA [Caldilineales bacterium]MDW8268314.1 tRNA 2-thiouridine(34) synthase MnmA [Anaerolineae bacterium]
MLLQLGLTPTRPPAETTVVVAMSGGVDSSVAAARLVAAGYRVIGVMMRLWSEVEAGQGSENRCCTLEATEDARRVAAQLDIPFYLLNVEEVFRRRVVDFFIGGYLAGLTPNPCLVCNRTIRFDYLLNYALALGADYLATGHYARVRAAPDGFELLRGVDERKDQSYVLSVLGQAELRHLTFPVGDLTKTEVRELARHYGLPVAARPESQDLCFLADGDYRRFLRDWAGAHIRPGPIVDVEGRVLGQHEGLPFYTIGQRKGLNLGGSERLFVLELRPETNTLVVGPAEQLGRDRFSVGQVNWIHRAPDGPLSCTVKIRYRAADRPALVRPLAADRVEVVLTEPVRDLAPGQAAVFYDGERVLGGGIIER